MRFDASDDVTAARNKPGRGTHSFFRLGVSLSEIASRQNARPVDQLRGPATCGNIGLNVTQSARGSRFVERMLTTIETCRLQNRNVFEYLTAAVEAHLAQRKAPLLRPTP